VHVVYTCICIFRFIWSLKNVEHDNVLLSLLEIHSEYFNSDGN
jgi:hypothetical protein